jgi:hypothetical protein
MCKQIFGERASVSAPAVPHFAPCKRPLFPDPVSKARPYRNRACLQAIDFQKFILDNILNEGIQIDTVGFPDYQCCLFRRARAWQVARLAQNLQGLAADE